MYMRYYDSYPALSGRTHPKKEPPAPKEPVAVVKNDLPEEIEITDEVKKEFPAEIASRRGLLQSIQADDIILIGLLILLLSESDDIIMPLIIGYLLLGDILPI